MPHEKEVKFELESELLELLISAKASDSELLREAAKEADKWLVTSFKGEMAKDQLLMMIQDYEREIEMHGLSTTVGQIATVTHIIEKAIKLISINRSTPNKETQPITDGGG